MGKTRVTLAGKTVLVTGSPGFVGANLVLRLLRDMGGGTVVSLDNMNDYYAPALKEYRLRRIEEAAKESLVRHVFVKGSVADKALVEQVFSEYKPQVAVHLAAQAGVRYSIDHPDVYVESNLIGFFNILEACRRHPVEHLVYASSSSVYGGNKKVPFSTDDRVDNPVSLYAATKKSNELMAHSYAKLYNIPSTGLRFFTVYGPAGRPDMFYYSATEKLARGETISIFNYGNCQRDFTYIDDIVEGVWRVMQGAPEKRPGRTACPFPLRRVQYRRRHAGKPAGIHPHPPGRTGAGRGAAKGLRFRRPPEAGPHAARRRARDLRRQRGPGTGLRLPPPNRHPARAAGFRGMVRKVRQNAVKIRPEGRKRHEKEHEPQPGERLSHNGRAQDRERRGGRNFAHGLGPGQLAAVRRVYVAGLQSSAL
uniref:Putative NAD dependent epimerase/dehydratase family protein n=1 Tax=uncultured bacterium Ad_095_K16_contig2 TaxID=1489294 RepID=A0A0B4N0W9_9BACT|nr:putative NAD dependent epimerase/dehydratase family protein [uncultured bacterium Ad_095_K16_contig2]